MAKQQYKNYDEEFKKNDSKVYMSQGRKYQNYQENMA